MDHQKQIAVHKRELVTQLSNSRRSITQSRDALQKQFKEQLQPKQLLGKLLSKKPKALFAGSAVAGLAAALFLRRPRKTKKATPQSTRLVLLGWILSLLKPAAKAWIITRAKEAAIQSAVPRQPAPQVQMVGEREN